MSISGRKRASLVLLLVLAAGLALAGAAAASAQEMACCPAVMESGCTWLGAGDCCPERPAARVSPRTTPPPAAACYVLTVPALDATRLAAPVRAVLSKPTPRKLVLRL